MNLLLLTSSYPPEIRSSSVLIKELAVALLKNGHCVSVLTTSARYNLAPGVVPPVDANRFSQVDEDGVSVWRVPSSNIHNSGPLQRAIAFLTVPFVLLWHARRLPRVDAVIMYSPPLTLAITAIGIKWRFGGRFILNVQDLFPQNIIDLGLLKNPMAIALVRWFERFVYRYADVITCHSPSNQDILKKTAPLHVPVRIVHNWIDAGLYSSESNPTVRDSTGTQNKFVVFFAGVMGFAQGLDVVIEAARRVKFPDIRFLLVGDGVAKPRLMEMADGLPNVIFHPFVPAAEYPRWVASCDVGLVTLDPKMKTPVIPSKILGYMASGKPFVASVNPESDLRHIVAQAQCGLMAEAGDPDAFAKAVDFLYENREKREKMGRNGRDFCLAHFTKEACIREYEDILSALKEQNIYERA